ncbi:MAG: hypothetical protein AAF533_05025 [Acidobacteriota bacterium]
MTELRHVTPTLVLLGIVAGSASAAPAVPGRSHVLTPGHAPTPFTADQIRRGCADGHRIVFRIEQGSGPAMLQTTDFSAGDAEGVTVSATARLADGTPMGEPQESRSAWKALQGHASFPAEVTRITPTDALESGLGVSLPGWIYEVRGEDGGTMRFSFASDLPGPPVKLEQRDASGALTMSMVMVESVRVGR